MLTSSTDYPEQEYEYRMLLLARSKLLSCYSTILLCQGKNSLLVPYGARGSIPVHVHTGQLVFLSIEFFMLHAYRFAA